MEKNVSFVPLPGGQCRCGTVVNRGGINLNSLNDLSLQTGEAHGLLLRRGEEKEI